jgi:hypothetical protein
MSSDPVDRRMNEDSPNFSLNEPALAAAALEHVRAIFKGNGVRSDKITVLSHKIAQHALNAGTYLELKPALTERTAPGKVVAGQTVHTREEAMRAIDQTMMQAARDPAAKAQIANVLLSRADQGFGMSRQAVSLDFLKREYTWHEACNTCRGTTQAPCQRCQGRRLETCIKCTGRGLMPCPLCRATGLLQGNKCNRCHGQRYVPCDGCQRSGMMGCRMCSATGVMKCTTCAGQGWKSHILALAAQAMTYFEYDAKSIPKGAADTIETQAQILSSEQKIQVRGRIADDKENVLGASYEVDFPYGEIIFQVGKKEVKSNLFGYKSDLVEFPYVLDKILGPSVQELEEAAVNVGSVADKIKNATRFRLIAQAFLSASRTSVKKTVSYLMKTYDIGLSVGMAEKIAILADQTTANITRKPRLIGMMVGLMVAAGLNAVYYLLPVRSAIAAYLPNPKFDFVLDILPFLLGGFITMVSIQLVAANSIRKALGHLIPAGQKKSLMPRAQSMGTWGYVVSALLTLVMMEVAAHTNASSPYWYEIVRNFAAQLLGL